MYLIGYSIFTEIKDNKQGGGLDGVDFNQCY